MSDDDINKKYEELNEKYKFEDRRFLNKNGFHSSANIVAKIHIDRYGKDALLNISDCSRTISLEIDLGDDKEIENTLFKLDQIIETCKGMKDKVANMYACNVEVTKLWEKYEKEKENV